MSNAAPVTAQPPAPQLSPPARHSLPLLAAIAAQMTDLAAGAEGLGVVLCSDTEIASRHLVELQQIDRLAQSLREMAGVLTASDPGRAVAEIRLGELRAGLEQSNAR